MNKSKNQHWVPQFYLRGFSIPETRRSKNPRVWILHKDTGDPTHVNIKKVAVKKYLYSPRNALGERSWLVDDRLEALESLVGRVWSAVSNDFVDLNRDAIRKALSLFVATLILRHPKNIDEICSLHKKMMKIYTKLPSDSFGKPFGSLIINGVESEIDNSDWKEYSNATEQDHQHFFANSILTETGYIAKILLEKRWSIVVSDQPVFITSDIPVAICNAEEEVFGLGTKGTAIFFPLSPTRILCMDDKHTEPQSQYYPLLSTGPASFNQMQWLNVHNFMISDRKPEGVLLEIIKFEEHLCATNT